MKKLKLLAFLQGETKMNNVEFSGGTLETGGADGAMVGSWTAFES